MITNKSNESTLAELTDTKDGTAEQGALKTIHRNYNKLSGFHAMLHIINRFRFVLYPFIFLSVAGSTYSFYNDFIVAFPMMGNNANMVIAFFYSVMLEIVRDGAIIAIFNGKMNKPSRGLVIVIFLVVTSYMYSSHLKAIDVIEKHAIEYTLANQSIESQSVTNPKIGMINENLNRAKKRLETTETERAKQLDISANAKYRVNKVNAQKQIPLLDAKIEKLEATISNYQTELLTLQDNNIKSVEDSQKLISRILLATLLLTESLAMLGAVIKFINTDNAKKEIAKHSEIIEEYVEISEQMKRDNEELTKNLSNVVKGQSESNQNVMKMISDDMRESAKVNIQFIQAIANNKKETMQQMNQVLQMINSSSTSNFNQPIQAVAEQHQDKVIGFKVGSEKDLVRALFQDGYIKEGDKLTSKTMLIDTNNRTESKQYREVLKTLSDSGVVEFKRGYGYYALSDYETALRVIH